MQENVHLREFNVFRQIRIFFKIVVCRDHKTLANMADSIQCNHLSQGHILLLPHAPSAFRVILPLLSVHSCSVWREGSIWNKEPCTVLSQKLSKEIWYGVWLVQMVSHSYPVILYSYLGLLCPFFCVGFSVLSAHVLLFFLVFSPKFSSPMCHGRQQQSRDPAPRVLLLHGTSMLLPAIQSKALGGLPWWSSG